VGGLATGAAFAIVVVMFWQWGLSGMYGANEQLEESHTEQGSEEDWGDETDGDSEEDWGEETEDVASTRPTLADYREACERLNSELSVAAFAVPSTMRMTIDNSALVQAAISLDRNLSPANLIEVVDVTTGSILVSCIVEARLQGASGEFEIEEPGWQSRSLFTAQTVRWTWFVTPKRLGEHHLTLQLRPVLRIHDGWAEPTDESLTEASTFEESILVTVIDPSLGDRMVRSLEGTTRVLRSVEGLLLALAAVLVATAAVKGGLRWRERREKAGTRQHSGGAVEPEGSTGLPSPEDGQPDEPRGPAASSAAGATPSRDNADPRFER
jgi:hypothetical protein